MTKVFIDGQEGTTGLKLRERLADRKDVTLLTIDDTLRKDTAARKELINASDVTFLCLPDAAAVDAVALLDNDKTKIIDASTAHRTLSGWAYGFPELSETFAKNVIEGKRVAVPGCHASGFLSIVYPLVAAGIVPVDYPLVCHSLTGYSGGGKKMIAEYEGAKTVELESPRQYGLGQTHKHLKEMKSIAGLASEPIFCPIVADFYSGMEVSIPLYKDLIKGTAQDIFDVLSAHYAGKKLITVSKMQQTFLAANKLSGKNSMEIFVGGNEDRILVASVFDNLGKGASGAAVQCFNLMTGVDETTGLV